MKNENTAKMAIYFFLVKPNKNNDAGNNMLFSSKQRVRVKVTIRGLRTQKNYFAHFFTS